MKKILQLMALTATIHGLLSAQTAPSAADNAAALVNHLVDTHIGVERMIPKGWSITAKPVAAARGPGDSIQMQVHIFILGAPQGTLFEQQVLPVGEDKPTSAMQGISAGKDGLLVCAGRSPEQCGDPKKPDDPIEFTVSALRGEPYRFLFISDAGTIGTVIVPNPVAARDKGCGVSAVRLTTRFELALITGSGFAPNSDVHYEASPGSNGTQAIRSNDLGVVRFALLPYAKPGQKSGTTKLKIKEPQCSPEISYQWGGN